MRVREAPRRVLKKTTRAKIRVVALGFKRKDHGHHPKQLPWDGVKGGGVKGKQPCLPAHQQKPRLDLSASHTSDEEGWHFHGLERLWGYCLDISILFSPLVWLNS